MTYLPYNPDLETVTEDERELFVRIAETFTEMGERVAAKEDGAMRVSHAKANALLEGELIVGDGLPSELAQGLAARPGRYRVLVRLAQGAGEPLPDRISTHRGMAVRISGLDGDVIAESNHPGVQDFVFEAHSKAFINSNAARFFANLRGGVANAPALPDAVKNAVSKSARGTEMALEAVGLESKTLGFFGHPPRHPLAEAYFSQVPMRWGDYVAKLGFYPTEATCAAVAEIAIDGAEDDDAFRNATIAHFAASGAEFELRVQLATDLEETAIEDAAKQWPEADNPYRTVARLVLPAQTAWSERAVEEEQELSFRPANSLVAHRPLGQIMRARLFVYRQLADWRRRQVQAQPVA